MGAFGDSIAAYAQPLIDQAHGSPENMEKALSLAMLFWNLAILPDAEHDDFLADMKESLHLSDEEFRRFRRDLVDPMVRRHREMFPAMNPQRRQMLQNIERPYPKY
jgi:hypothetical protein